METDNALDCFLVSTKLQPPRGPLDAIERQRLTARILDGLAGPLTLVYAPACFGKTVAVETAAAASPWPVAWLTVGAADDSLPLFVRYFVAAIQQYFPESCRSTLSLLQLPRLPAPTAIVQVLEEDLDALPDDCVVVLDDYDKITSAHVDTLLVALLPRLPPQVHLLVASRNPPAWPLARLRAAGLLVEVDADHLRFTRAETQAFLTRATGRPVDELTSAMVHQRMGGWAAALRMAAIELRSPAGLAGTLDDLEHRAEANAIHYLLDEIVAKQPPHLADFLARTAICDRISPALADALLAGADYPPDSAALLAQLEQAGLFVARDDAAGVWYRYHDLLRAALERRLRQQCDAAQIRTLHSRAGAWFARGGRVAEAVRHALLADERLGAAAIVEAHAAAAFEQQQWAQVAEWLELLPPEPVEERPRLLLAAGWVAHRRLQYGRLTAILERATEWVERHAPGLSPRRIQAIEAEIDALWAGLRNHYGDAQRAFDLALSAWERLPSSAAHARGQAGCTLGMAAQVLGRPDVVASLIESDRGIELHTYPAAALHVRLAVLNMQFATGDFAAAEQTASYLVSRATEQRVDFIAAWAHYALGRIHYERDDLHAAAKHYTSVVDLRHSAPVFALRASLQGLALTSRGLDRPLPGSEPIAQLYTLPGGPYLVEEEVARAFDARLALVHGNREAALEWLHRTPPQPSIEHAIAVEVPAITRVAVLLAEASPAAIEIAAREVARLIAVYTARHDAIHVIELLVLQALAAEAQGSHEQALAALEQAVRLGMPGGFVRTFVDRGPALARLLAQLPARDDTCAYVERLRIACGTLPAWPVPPVPHREAMWPDLTEPLTAREAEVLDLLARRLSNKEIATTLHVSWQTVAKHTNNIYQKLRVTGRRDAVVRAEALGILPVAGGAATEA
jgi:LuxR family maltose regulon positive regulatory protein